MQTTDETIFPAHELAPYFAEIERKATTAVEEASDEVLATTAKIISLDRSISAIADTLFRKAASEASRASREELRDEISDLEVALSNLAKDVESLRSYAAQLARR